MTDHAPGTPSWVDLATSDIDATIAFYGELFGWTVSDPGPPELGGYRNFLDGGRIVAGVSPMGEVPAWTTYFSVTSAQDTAETIATNGGRILVAPMDVGNLGRMSICADPEGAVFGLWEPGEHRGAEKIDDPVSLAWNELNSRALYGAATFYAAAFGWHAQDAPLRDDSVYTMFSLGGRGIAGGFTLPPDAPADVPAHWLTWFSVADCDATITRLEGLGGAPSGPAFDMPGVGRLAVVADPLGARFGLMQSETADG